MTTSQYEVLFLTLAEHFGKWRPYLELFWATGGGGRNLTGGRGPLEPPLPTTTREVICWLICAVISAAQRWICYQMTDTTNKWRERTVIKALVCSGFSATLLYFGVFPGRNFSTDFPFFLFSQETGNLVAIGQTVWA